MVLKPLIYNWHREEFLEGKWENIPEHILETLKAEYGAEAPKNMRPITTSMSTVMATLDHDEEGN
jgi:hypothetical protein